MTMETLAFELEAEADCCCVEDVVVLEIVELAPTGPKPRTRISASWPALAGTATKIVPSSGTHSDVRAPVPVVIVWATP